MPTKKHHASKTTRSKKPDHVAFYPLLLLTLIVWIVYRQLKFPIWFDEMIGKAVFFGLPVWLYVSVSRAMEIPNSFALSKFKNGVLLGIAFGGLYGFTATLLRLFTTGAIVQPAMLFNSNLFWYEFLLSLFTGFWETLFFFSWVMVVVEEKYYYWPLAKQVVLTALIFLVFHVPNTFLRFTGMEIVSQLIVLFLFAIGQGFLFAYRRNAYALILSHAIWGMVLLVHLN